MQAGMTSMAILIALVGAVLLSALGLVASTHYCRMQYVDLQRLELSRWALQEDYSRLLLEFSTRAAPRRVDRLAREQMDMVVPTLDDYRLVGQ